jgi:dihydroorotase
MKPELWNPENPLSHCDARPQKAEIESIKDQIRFANEACFKGILHICHVTLPESVALIENARQSGLNITYGLTPHHLLIARENVKTTTLSLYYKANPPIRTAEKVSGLYKYLRKESFGWIESDHAPHKITEKLEPPYMSGMPNLDTYSNFICKINRDFDISWGHISALTSCNIAKAFGFETVGIEIGKPADLTCLSFEMETIKRKNLRTNCGWSPYEEFIFPGRTKATIVNGNIVYRGF